MVDVNRIGQEESCGWHIPTYYPSIHPEELKEAGQHLNQIPRIYMTDITTHITYIIWKKRAECPSSDIHNSSSLHFM
jgi:hypothetical protein